MSQILKCINRRTTNVFTINSHKLVRCKSKSAVRSRSFLEPVIGLEIHAQISSTTKLFSGAKSEYAAPTNDQVAFLDAALPGTLPRLNHECVKAGVLTAMALRCHVNRVSKFDRKHYFYADLPAGYQITQQREPIARTGEVTYALPQGSNGFLEKVARITQVQLEQDSGKSLHDADDKQSLIDLNRAGSALMEIVTEPDFSCAEEAVAFVKELRNILLLVGTCDGKMEEGSLRVDASISLHEPGTPLGTRAEIKNLNSIRYIAKAIEYEIKRQRKLLENGKEVENETRAFDVKTNKTIAMRDKEKLHDYRFMPEPNLPPLCLYTNNDIPPGMDPSQIVNVDEIATSIPELPFSQRKHLAETYSLEPKLTLKMSEIMGMTDFFDKVFRENPSRNLRDVNSLMSHLIVIFNGEELTFQTCHVTPQQLGELADLMAENRLTFSCAKLILRSLAVKKCASVKDVINEMGLWKITNVQEITKLCTDIIHAAKIQESNPNKEEKKKKKKTKDLVKKYVVALKNEQQNRVDEETAKEIFQKLLEHK